MTDDDRKRPPRFETFGTAKTFERNYSGGKEIRAVKRKRSCIQAIREITKMKNPGEIDGVVVDVYTAEAITKVYAVLTRLHKKQFAEMDIQTQGAIALKLVAKYGLKRLVGKKRRIAVPPVYKTRNYC